MLAACWAVTALTLFGAVARVASQPIDPSVRAAVTAEFSEQINLQRVALLGQLGGPNSAFGGLGVLSSLNTLNELAAFGNTFNTAQDLSTLIQALTNFEAQIAQLSAQIVCRNRVPGCATCDPTFAVCVTCLPPFVLGPAGASCQPAPPIPTVAPFPIPGVVPGGYGGTSADPAAISFFAASEEQLQASSQTAIAANFPIGK